MDDNLRMDFDPIADAGYIYLTNKQIMYTKEVTDDLLVDIAADGTAVGIDIQRWSEWIDDKLQNNIAP